MIRGLTINMQFHLMTKIILLILVISLPSRAQDGRTNHEAALGQIVNTQLAECRSMEPPLEVKADFCSEAIKSKTLNRDQIAEVLRFRGIIYLKLTQYQKAIEDFNLSIQLSSEVGLTYYYKGLTFEAMGEDKKANGQYKNARLYSPGDPVIIQKIIDRNLN